MINIKTDTMAVRNDKTGKYERFVAIKGDKGEGVIAGGKTGQALIKNSDTDYDTTWGDAYTLVTGTLTAGNTAITLNNSNITENSIIDFYTSIYGVSPETAVISSGKVALTFDAQESDMTVAIKIEGTY